MSHLISPLQAFDTAEGSSLSYPRQSLTRSPSEASSTELGHLQRGLARPSTRIMGNTHRLLYPHILYEEIDQRNDDACRQEGVSQETSRLPRSALLFRLS